MRRVAQVQVMRGLWMISQPEAAAPEALEMGWTEPEAVAVAAAAAAAAAGSQSAQSKAQEPGMI